MENNTEFCYVSVVCISTSVYNLKEYAWINESTYKYIYLDTFLSFFLNYLRLVLLT